MRTLFKMTVLFGFFSHPVFAGVRELCRAELSGRMITASSDKKMYDDLVVSLKESLEPMIKEKRRLESSYEKKSKSSDKGNIYSEQELNELRTRIQSIGQHISDLSTDREKAKANLVLANRKVDDLQSRLKKIFEFTRVNEPEAGLMTWRLDYKASCPKFRENCPLPEHMRNALKTILEKDTPENCIHYANFK